VGEAARNAPGKASKEARKLENHREVEKLRASGDVPTKNGALRRMKRRNRFNPRFPSSQSA
jgi:hypothetical protein